MGIAHSGSFDWEVALISGRHSVILEVLDGMICFLVSGYHHLLKVLLNDHSRYARHDTPNSTISYTQVAR